MEKFATLEPVRLYASSAATTGARLLHLSHSNAPKAAPPPLIGRLPTDLHALIFSHLPIPDIPAYSRVSRAIHTLVLDDNLWAPKWLALALDIRNLSCVLDTLEEAENAKFSIARAALPPTLSVPNDQDDFGDFADVQTQGQVISAPMDEMGDFVGSAGGMSTSGNTGMFNFFAAQPKSPAAVTAANQKPSKRQLYIRAHNLLKPLYAVLVSNPPHLILPSIVSLLASPVPTLSPTTPLTTPVSASSQLQPQTIPPTLLTQSKALHLLARFLSPSIQPVREWHTHAITLRATMDRFDASLLAAFDIADGKGDEAGMREASEASWEVWEGAGVALDGGSSSHRSGDMNGMQGAGGTNDRGGAAADWEMGKVWAEKREIFYIWQGRWDPLDNFTSENGLDFDAMDEFMTAVTAAIAEHGARAVRVFPPAAGVLISFAERIAGEVIGEYITTLLTRARELQPVDLFLQAAAASFREAWRLVDAVMSAANEREDSGVQKERSEDVVYQMFESNMDEYLDEEVECIKHVFEVICKGWDSEASQKSTNPSSTQLGGPSQPRFLSSQNPAQVKRNVLASFTSVLLLPVTIVPRTMGAVGGALITGGTAAAQGIAMLNPQRWGGSGNARRREGGGGVSAGGWGVGAKGVVPEKENEEKEDRTLFDVGKDEDSGDEDGDDNHGEKEEVNEAGMKLPADDPWAERDKAQVNNAVSKTPPNAPSIQHSRSTSSYGPSNGANDTASTNLSSQNANATNKLELLLSLDIALEVIHADRESLKRVETFVGYPGHYGQRVHDTIEEIFILMLHALSEGHLSKGFSQATQQMTMYKPAEHEETTSVAPLLQFFELVHIGDTIQSMVQVYFDKELAHHIDRTDFLNAVVREKKRFENTLDDSVAGGLNAGTEVLMNQVEHIILTLTKPREYYPSEDGPLDLGPTKGCTEAIKCLEMHCRLLRGSTSKEVLEVFYQEVGIRLIAILQKHIKRQIISLSGGFQVIADLNTYHAFISSLKVPSITSDFSHLKMLGHVFVVEDAKDLAQIVRDVTRYGGAYRPEDIYEFIQRRSDWKKIEKTVDKTMYNLSFKEDCVVC